MADHTVKAHVKFRLRNPKTKRAVGLVPYRAIVLAPGADPTKAPGAAFPAITHS